MNLLLEWLAFCRDLSWIAAAATAVLYLFKLLRPSHEIDRVANLAMAVASLGVLAANVLGAVALKAMVPWALFVLVPIGLFWSLEFEFATRLMGLGTAALIGGASLLLGRCPALPLPDDLWPELARGGTLAGSGLVLAAALVAGLRALARISPLVNSRRRARFFGLSAAASAEIVYRHLAWALPCELFAFAAAALAFTQHLLSWYPMLALAVGTALSAGYTFWCRPSQLEPGIKPMMVAACALAALVALRLLGTC